MLDNYYFSSISRVKWYTVGGGLGCYSRSRPFFAFQCLSLGPGIIAGIVTPLNEIFKPYLIIVTVMFYSLQAS